MPEDTCIVSVAVNIHYIIIKSFLFQCFIQQLIFFTRYKYEAFELLQSHRTLILKH